MQQACNYGGFWWDWGMSDCFTNSRLAGFANITMGQSPSSERYNKEKHGLPFLQGCAEFGSRYPSPEIYCYLPLRIAKRGSILISVRAPVGTMNVADQDYCIGRGLGAIQGISGVSDTSFLRYAIEQNAGFLHRRSQGSTFLAIGSDDLRHLPLPKLNIKIQERIAEILAIVDATITKTESLIAKYQQIKGGLMHDLFTRGVTADGKLRPPHDKAPELYKETLIGWIPKEWMFTSCVKVCETIIDCKNRTPPETPDGYPVIRTPNVRNGEFVNEELLFTDVQSYAIWTARGKPRPRDVVITREAPVGEVCMIPDSYAAVCLGQRMMLYRPNVELIDPVYFLFALQSRQIQNRLDLISGGSTVGHVRVGDIRELWMFMPSSRTEQKQIAGSVIAVTSRLQLEKQRHDKLTRIKQGLMHDLLTGKVPLKVKQEPVEMVCG